MKKRIDKFGLVGLNTDVAPSLLAENMVSAATNIRTKEASIGSVGGEVKLFDLAVLLNTLNPTSSDWSDIEFVTGDHWQVFYLTALTYSTNPPPNRDYDSSSAAIGDAVIWVSGGWVNKGPLADAKIWIEPVYHTTFVDDSQTSWVIVSNGKDVVAFNLTGDVQVITPTVDGDTTSAYDSFIESFVSMAVLNGVFIVNSELSGPFYWPGPDSPVNPLQPLPGPGDTLRNWLSGSGVPGSGLGSNGDYYRDTATIDPIEPAFSGNWYTKQSGSWVLTSTVAGTVEYGWNWQQQWRCRYMTAYKYYLVAVGMVETGLSFGSLVRWSDSTEAGAIPIEWFPRTYNNAGSDVLGETPGLLITAVKVRDSLYLIKEDSIFQMRWIGGQYVMSITRLQGTIGTSIPMGCTEMQGTVLIFTNSDLLVFDGQQQFSITDDRIKKGIFGKISGKDWAKSRIFYFEPENTLFIAFATPGSGQLTDAQVYDSIKKVWGHKSLLASYGFDSIAGANTKAIPTWDELGGAPLSGLLLTGWQIGLSWDEQIYGGWDTSAYQASTISLLNYESNGLLNTDPLVEYWVSASVETNTTSIGEAKYCSVERKAMPILGTDLISQVNEVWVGFSGTATLTINIGSQNFVDDEIVWATNKDGLINFTLGPTDTPVIDPLIAGRYISWRIFTQEDAAWELNSLTFDIEDGGE